jgi:hypothetical protein
VWARHPGRACSAGQLSRACFFVLHSSKPPRCTTRFRAGFFVLYSSKPPRCTTRFRAGFFVLYSSKPPRCTTKFRAGFFVLYSIKPPRCTPSSGQAPLYYIVANHLAASPPTCGHALLQVAVCLQHNTLLMDWLELLSGSGHTTYLYAAACLGLHRCVTGRDWHAVTSVPSTQLTT